MAYLKLLLCTSGVLARATVSPNGRWWDGLAKTTREEHPSISSIIEGSRSKDQPKLAVDFVGFDDMIKALPDTYEVQTSWDCIGHVPNSTFVYVCYTTWKNTNVRTLFANQDTLVFRYNIETKERTFVGTFMEAAAKANNLWKGEIIPKGHTHIVYTGGKMWIGSQNFHDFKFDINVTELDSYHGGHLFSIDPNTLELADGTAKGCPNGVAVDHQGIVAQNHIPKLDLVIGLTHPYSDLALYNAKTHSCEKVVKGIPWTKGNPLSREIVALPNGHIYVYRGVEDPRYDDPDTEFPVWMYDHSTGKMAATNTTMSNGIWDSHAYKKDGTGIYIASSLGQLWYLDTKTEKWSDLGIFLPKEALDKDIRIASLYTIALTPAEDKLYGIVSFYYPKQAPQLVINGGDLFVKDLKTGEVSFVQALGHGVYTGSGITVGDSMYFAKAGSLLNDYWIGNVSLGIIHFDQEAGPAKVEYV